MNIVLYAFERVLGYFLDINRHLFYIYIKINKKYKIITKASFL